MFYGEHYSAFIYSAEQKLWRFADDAAVRPVGSWKQVVELCVRGRLQPSVLFYEVAPPAVASGHGGLVGLGRDCVVDAAE